MNDMVLPKAGPALMNDAERAEYRERMIDVLLSGPYSGCKRESVAMVYDYCESLGLDMLHKPVHVVPMRVKTGQKNRNGYDEYTMRDTVMPGIGLYRTIAHRTGEYAGMDAPVFGPTKGMKYQKRVWVEVPGRDQKQPRDIDAEIEYPEWVMVTVWRLVGGFRSPFPAKEFWQENYATAGPDTNAPNAMWSKRPIAQLIKCAEAQALRKGFPEVGAAPTAEEMEGRDFDPDYINPVDALVEKDKPKTPKRASEAAGNVSSPTPPAPPALPDGTAAQQQAQAMVQPPAEPPAPAPVQQQAAAPAPAPVEPPPPPPPAVELASQGEKNNILVTCKIKNIELKAKLAELGISLPDDLSGLTKPQFKQIKAAL